MTQSLDTKLARTAVAMSNCDEDQPIDFCHIGAVREAREEISRLASENTQLLSDVRTLQAEAEQSREMSKHVDPSKGNHATCVKWCDAMDATDASGALTRWRTK